MTASLDTQPVFFEVPASAKHGRRRHLFSVHDDGAACNRGLRPKRTGRKGNARRRVPDLTLPGVQWCGHCVKAWHAGWGLEAKA